MASTRIPRGIHQFFAYIVNTNAYLLLGTPNNGVRLGILPTESTTWAGFLVSWNAIINKYTDKKNSRTTLIKDSLNLIIANCVLFDQTNHILDRIASSLAVTLADLEAFNIKKGVSQQAKGGSSTTTITEPVIPVIKPIGGALISIKCYSSQGNRPGIFSLADSVQYAYVVGDKPPVAADDATLTKEMSSKGSFTLNLSPSNSGSSLYIYLRWYCIANPAQSGPWTLLQTSLIL